MGELVADHHEVLDDIEAAMAPEHHMMESRVIAGVRTAATTQSVIPGDDLIPDRLRNHMWSLLHPTMVEERIMEKPRCPECVNGKCVNCALLALDETTDEIVACTCTHEEN